MDTSTPHPTRAALAREIIADTSAYPAGCNVHLFPDGTFQSNDGRPARQTNAKLTHWRMNADIARAMIASHTRPILFDIDHNSINGATRASGWITALAYEPGKGLFGKVEWTKTAAEAIAAKEYRYLSPYFEFNQKSGAIEKILSAALTNDPALEMLGAVALQRQNPPPFHQPSGDDMDPTQIAALTSERDTLKSQTAALTAERDTLKAQTAALTAERDALKKQIDDAATAAINAEREALITAACSGDSPKMTPALADAMKGLPIDALKKAIEAMPAMTAAQRQTESRGDAGDGLSEAERAMCQRMGVKPEDFKQAKA